MRRTRTSSSAERPEFGGGPIFSLSIGAYGTVGAPIGTQSSTLGAGAALRATFLFIFEGDLTLGGMAGFSARDWNGVAIGGGLGLDLLSWPPAADTPVSFVNVILGLRVSGLIRTDTPGTEGSLELYVANVLYAGCRVAVRLEFDVPFFNFDWFPPSISLTAYGVPSRTLLGDPPSECR